MTKRQFIPGSEWLYFKLYCGNKTADTILVNDILPLGESLTEENLSDKWFFIRYSDPGFHIRFRIHIPRQEHYGPVFNRVYPVFEKLKETGRIYNLQCDTYNRELSRYGTENFHLTETLFYADSLYVLKILAAIRDAEDPDMERWRLSLRLIDDTLEIFRLTPVMKRDFMFAQSEGFKKEFGYTSIPMIRQLNDKYRTNRKWIESVFAADTSPGGFLPAYSFAAARAGKIREISRNILVSHLPDKALFNNYAAGIIHMTMNRLFHSSNRMYEMVIYDFLYRYYRSSLARTTAFP